MCSLPTASARGAEAADRYGVSRDNERVAGIGSPYDFRVVVSQLPLRYRPFYHSNVARSLQGLASALTLCYKVNASSRTLAFLNEALSFFSSTCGRVLYCGGRVEARSVFAPIGLDFCLGRRRFHALGLMGYGSDWGL
jgi:hypothetical protein